MSIWTVASLFNKKTVDVFVFGYDQVWSNSCQAQKQSSRDVLRKTEFTGKHLCQRLVFNKLSGLALQAY